MSNPQPSSLPPVHLKDFVVTEKLGSGSYGDVFKARRKSGPREVVAVKCVLKSKLSKAAIDNLLTEISMLKTLKHEHIVSMQDFVWDANFIYIVMEYCAGGDLSRFIRTHKTLSEEICRRFLQQLAAALFYLRSKSVSHMDLKPSNILIFATASRPILKLADFGFATHFSSDETKSDIIGTPLYMAPEMVLRKKYDAKVDLWSVGVILYECLFGKAPYKSNSVEECIAKLKEDKPIAIPDSIDLSPECKDLLTGLLQRDPDKRMDFPDFFEHKFVDLEHMPSAASSKKATALIEKAVAKDKAGEWNEALALYTEALEYFIPLVQYQKTKETKETLRKKTIGYIKRAEEIKTLMNPSAEVSAVMRPKSPMTKQSSVQQRSSDEMSDLSRLLTLCSLTPKLHTGVEIAKAAELYELEGSYPLALAKYESALSLLLPLLATEPTGERKTMLHKEVTKWLRRAECVKAILNEQERVMASKPALGSPVDSKQCIVQ